MTSDRGRLTRRHLFAGSLGSILLSRQAPAFVKSLGQGDKLRFGLVGHGGRGSQLLTALGYSSPKKESNVPVAPDERLDDGAVIAICDPMRRRVENGLNTVKASGGEARGYSDYHEMLKNEQLDCVIVSCCDHHHAPATMAAMQAGCDVYVEKCMTNDLAELKQVREVMQRTGRILQVGHQGRQDAVHRAAATLVEHNELGKVTLVETFLSRGGVEQAWLRPELVKNHPLPAGIDWKAFLGNAPQREFDAHRFFEWRRYWDYSTGIAGDLMSHEIDSVHHIMKLGVPGSVVSSGGVYYWKDGRETPDTYSVIFEYPERDLSVTYSANIHNNYQKRASIFLGSDATMELDHQCRVYPERTSEKHAADLKSGKLKPDEPMLQFGKLDGQLGARASTSNLWLEYEGLAMTTRDGKIRDTSRLHMQEFKECVRERTQPSASFDACYATTVATLLSVVAYKTGKKVSWDPKNEVAVY